MYRKGCGPRLALLALLLLAGCGGGGEEVLLRDRFGDPSSGWGSDSQDAFDRGYREGEYFIEVYEPNWLTWAHPGNRFTDVVVEAEARPVSGSADGHFGLLCRCRFPDDFYYFAITEDGYYAILRVEDGEPATLTGGGFLPSPILRPGGGIRRIRAVCHGEQLTLYVNGQEVATTTDGALRWGDVAVAVGSGPGGRIRVHFDNLIVTAPGEQGEEREEE
jgi:hypothetical protein